MRKIVWVFILALVLMVAGCAPGFAPNATRTITPPKPPATVNASEIEFGIYPVAYTVGDSRNPYVKGATVELQFTCYNDLDYDSPARIVIKDPSSLALKRNTGYVSWTGAHIYCEVVGDTIVPANGNKEITIRIYVPENENSVPAKWMFYVAYQSEGHRWGNYTITGWNNFVFTPYGFTSTVTDSKQIFEWITWGNSPEVMLRASYDMPPQSITDGTLVYTGYGEQIIRKWDKGDGTILDRQYTQFYIEDDTQLPYDGGEKIFYRAWQKHLVRGDWDGTWDTLNQSIVVPEVQAKVIVNMQ